MKYTPIAPVGAASGSIGGQTYSRNRYGAYVRVRSLPVNPNTTRQSAIRAAFTALTQAWQNILTTAQRTAWATYAANVPLIDALGNPQNVTGFNMYIRSNTSRIDAIVAATRVDDAPTSFTLGDFTPPTFTIAQDESVSMAFTTGDAWVGEDDSHMLVYVSPPLNPTINFYKGPWVYIGKVDGDSITPPTSPAAFTHPNALATGQRVFTQVRVTRADGRLSSAVNSVNTVTA